MTDPGARSDRRLCRAWLVAPALLVAQHAFAAVTPYVETIKAWEEADGSAIVKIQGYAIPRPGVVDAHYMLFVVNQNLTPPEIARLELVATCDAKDAAPRELVHFKTTRARLVDGKFIDYATDESKPVKALSLMTDKLFTYQPATLACKSVVREAAGAPGAPGVPAKAGN